MLKMNADTVSSESTCSWYKPKSQFNETFEKLASLRRDSVLCDVVIEVGMKKFRAHKVVLAASSPYFEAMFLSGMSESHQQQVTLQGIDTDAFDSILGLIYDGQIRISTENVQSLLTTASIFQIDHLKEACSEFLEGHLAPHNTLGIKSFAEAHGCVNLAAAALRHGLVHFSEVSGGEEFLGLGLDQMLKLLSRDDLRVESEEQVFDAAVRWIEYDSTNRSQYMAKLLSLVRLPLLTPQLLVDKVKANPLVAQNIECRDLVDEALVAYHLLPERRAMIPAYKLLERRCLVNTGIIYAVGGLSSQEGTLSSVERYDSSKGHWEVSKSMLTLRSRIGVAAVDGLLYAFGGYDGTSRLQTVECYDPKHDEWSMKKPMTTKRSALAIAVYHKEVFVIGGYDGNTSLSTVEVYDTVTDSWRPSPSMHTRRSAAGAAVLEDFIFVAGGHDGSSIFNTVERFDPVGQVWTMVTPMHSRRCRLGVTATNGKLYSVGGYDGVSFLNSMECYDPAYNQWYMLAPMACRRSRVGVVAIARCIYAIGGYDGLANLNSVEVYKLESIEWTSAPSMSVHQGGVSVAVFPLD